MATFSLIIRILVKPRSQTHTHTLLKQNIYPQETSEQHEIALPIYCYPHNHISSTHTALDLNSDLTVSDTMNPVSYYIIHHDTAYSKQSTLLMTGQEGMKGKVIN